MDQIKAAIFDVDGTLFDYRENRIPQSTVDAIRKLKENGVTIVVATARSYPELSENLLAEINADYYVVASGQSIQDRFGRSMFSLRFTYEQVELLKKCVLKHDAGLTLKYDAYNCLYTHPAEMYRIYSNIGQPQCPTLYCDGMDRHRTELPLGFTVWGEGEIRESIAEALSAYPNDFRMELFGNGVVVDIYSPFANKKTALVQLMRRLNIDAKNCIAFGDSKNDLEMIRWAGIGVAMGNGREELKEAADLVCGATWEGGIAKQLKDLKLI